MKYRKFDRTQFDISNSKITEEIIDIINMGYETEISLSLDPDYPARGLVELREEEYRIINKLIKEEDLDNFEEKNLVGLLYDRIAYLTYQKMYYGFDRPVLGDELDERIKKAENALAFLKTISTKYSSSVGDEGRAEFIEVLWGPPKKQKTIIEICEDFITDAKNNEFYYINGKKHNGTE